jgi:hypothetical protein
LSFSKNARESDTFLLTFIGSDGNIIVFSFLAKLPYASIYLYPSKNYAASNPLGFFSASSI